MSDLQRLRRYKLQEGDGEPNSDLAELIADLYWASDRIEQLERTVKWHSRARRYMRAELERLLDALKDIVAADHCRGDDYCPHCIARAALGGGDDE